MAASAWERNLVLHFADGHRWSRGLDGFDLSELPWTADWPAERAFLITVLHKALTRHGRHLPAYDPPYALSHLRTYRAMVDGRPGPVPVPRGPRWGDWRVPPPADLLQPCPLHGVYQGRLGCRRCDPHIQPVPWPQRRQRSRP